jgi:hypothetical protein
MLDYLFGRFGQEELLDSEAARQKHFGRFGIRTDAFVAAEQFGELLPISVRRAGDSVTTCFPFIDEGQRSIAKFERFLITYDKLLCSLPDFEVIYVATSPGNFKEAHRLFARRFPATSAAKLALLRETGFKPPRATFATELVECSYPSMLNPELGYRTGQRADSQLGQKPLFTNGMQSDTG